MLIETTVANSALQRARATMQEHLPARRSEWSAGGRAPRTEERVLLERSSTHERCDAAAAIAIAAHDIRITMPPNPFYFEVLKRSPRSSSARSGEEREGDWRLVPTKANRMPTAASYLRRAGDSEFRAFKLDVLRIEQGVITEITTFGAELFPAFGLRQTL